MLSYVLNEEDFRSIKQYVDFLRDLPPALKVIEAFTDSIRRQGHQMLTPPDAQRLAQAAQGNALAWQAIHLSVPMIGRITADALRDTQLFIEEFRVLYNNAESGRLRLDGIGVRDFSYRWNGTPSAHVIGLIRALIDSLQKTEQAILDFHAALTSIGVTLHGVFARFIESLMLDLCSCDKGSPKIEVYYGLGKVGLPGMQYDPQRPYSESERLANAREHMARLKSLRIHAFSAVNNLTDFCAVLRHYLAEAQLELQAIESAHTLVRTNVKLALVGASLVDVQPMIERLMKVSDNLQ